MFLKNRETTMGFKTTEQIADWAHRLKFADLPADLVAHIKNLIIGYTSSSLAGSNMPIGRIATRYAKISSPVPQAGVFGGGFKTTLEMAALANATMSHSTELEDVSFPDGLYTLSPFGTVFAVAECNKLSGKELIEAFVVGYDIASHLGVVCQEAGSRGWMLSATFASVGNAAAAAKLMKLDPRKLLYAMGIGASQGMGMVRQSGTGAHTMEAGLAARNGITAARLADMGLDASATILEGQGGMCDLVGRLTGWECEEGYRVARIGIRKYPCCGLGQRVVDGMSDLVREKNLKAEDVDKIEVEANHTFGMYMKFSEPENAAQTRFSIEHAVAACFIENPVFLKSFTDEAARDPRYAAIRPKVRKIIHEEWEHGYFPQPAIVTVYMKDGSVLKKECVFARGDDGHPVTAADVERKYKGAINFVGAMSQSQADQAWDMIDKIESLKDVSELARIFSFPDKRK